MELDPNAKPVIHPPKKIPASVHQKLKKELDEMEKDVVISKVTSPTEWVNSLVIAEKPNGALRVYLDPRDLNKSLKREHFQLPTWEEISSRISGARHFTKLDASHGYWQIPLDLESSLMTTFNTPFGRYRFERLPFGILSAQEVFHKRIQEHDDILGCETDIDDFLIWVGNEEEHDIRLIKTLDRAKEIGLTMNIRKCTFRDTSIIYLGHGLTPDGVIPDSAKINAIVNMSPPEDKQGVQRLLGGKVGTKRVISNCSLARIASEEYSLVVDN